MFSPVKETRWTVSELARLYLFSYYLEAHCLPPIIPNFLSIVSDWYLSLFIVQHRNMYAYSRMWSKVYRRRSNYALFKK